MKTGTILAALLLLASRITAAQQATATSLFTAAQQQGDLFDRAQRPFELEAKITLHLASPTSGQLSIHFQSKNHWRRELSFGHYKETVVRNGEWEHALRSDGLAPLSARQVVELLEFGKDRKSFLIRTFKVRHHKGISLDCFALESSLEGLHAEVCADSATHDILSIKPWIYDIDGGDAEFTSFTPFVGMRFPHHLELHVATIPAVTIEVTKLEENEFDASLLTPPAGATARRLCDAMTEPKLMHPPNEAQMGIFPGDLRVRFQTTVLENGLVGAVKVISANPAESADVLKRFWFNMKYSPAMCGTEPVVAEVESVVDFQGNQTP